MSEQREALMRRRDVLRVMTAGVAVAAVGRLDEAEALPPDAAEKRKSRYQANSAGSSGLLSRQPLSVAVRGHPC